MSVKVKLEKNGEIVNGFTGFSWTIFFFGFWVPAFRNKLKDFGLFLIFFIIKLFFLITMFSKNIEIAENLEKYNTYDISYSSLIPYLILNITFLINVWLSYFYNKYYTTNLLINGYYPLENDEYSVAILKDYSYLPYLKEELDDNATMERYKNFSTFARKEEKSKAKTFFGMLAVFYVIIIFLVLSNFI